MRTLSMAIRAAHWFLLCGLASSQSPGQDAAVPLTHIQALRTQATHTQVSRKQVTRAEAARRALALSAVGRKMFFDPSLSGSGRLSCSSCHDPQHAYGPPNAESVQAGGKRAVPSLRYLQAVPEFTEHYFDSDGPDPSIDNGPTGGLTWDGRVDRGRDQARIPLLSPLEMANASPAAVVAKVRQAPYAAEFERLLGKPPADAFATVLEALEAWQQDWREFYPYSSKYDAWLAGTAQLSDLELRGLRVFSDPEKGNCAPCHIATRGANGTPPQFTDYGYAALGLPRNYRISANGNRAWYDLGLCGPERKDLESQAQYCGEFRTPTLRNTATRSVFFHNGSVHTLREAVEFYAQRDTRPQKWYPRNGDGSIAKFDDLPSRYWRNVEMATPFGGAAGSTPPLNDAEIDAIVAFLQTLNDGFNDRFNAEFNAGFKNILVQDR
jgi:cytochrome c peroxidase